MKVNVKKSSITLPPNELKLVKDLVKHLKAKSKVEVIRQGLFLLKERADRKKLREAYRLAAAATRSNMAQELLELDDLSSEGID